ncbi:MAG: aminodeoxychorismate synthase component I [Alphaproteobacteria bacterium]|nr:aminodeoxychorismate synthase component I [Alphaproteobacteria bacterium]
MSTPCLILDDAAERRLKAFSRPHKVIRADRPEEVRRALDAVEEARAAGQFVAGYVSYELGYFLEAKLTQRAPHNRVLPLLWFGVFDAPAVIEAEGIEVALERWSAGRAYAGPLRHDWDEAAYGVRFARVKALIAAGDIYQANLTFRSRFAFAGDPLALYRRLRARSAAPHAAYVDDGERRILSLSPELFFSVTRDGTITARPMKGTAPRGADDVSDLLARRGLAESPKDRAENLMIVDLLRNDLGRLACTGSVSVPQLFSVETYPTLHQMISVVTAQLKPGLSAADLLRALFPCGSVTGAPKIRAMEVIADLEADRRGIYCGAIGCFAPDGSAAFNVAIRTLTIAGGEGELGIGGAVVQDSDVAAEYAECLLKARYYDAGRRPLGLIETLRWSPDEGFVRLDLHLSRMARSARIFNIAFDEGQARQTLQAALPSSSVNGGRAGEGGTQNVALRLRLSLGEQGRFNCTAAPLPPGKPSWSFAISPLRVRSADVLARHKTDWRDLYEAEFVRLARDGACDEVVFVNERGEVAEGSRTSVFVRRGGRLVTPPLSAGILEGVLRQSLIAQGRCEEGVLRPEDLTGDVYLGNSLRGLTPARRAPS